MVGGVARRVQDLEAELRAFDRVALADDAIGDDRGVLVDALAVGEHLGTGCLHESFGSGRVVGVGVREDHPSHPFAHGRSHDGVDVGLVVGPGVDHRDFVDPHQVRVGAGARERPRVGRHDAPDERR